MQYPIVNLILKRMRSPLILLIFAYTIATAGMVIIPGVDNDGKEFHFTIFQAFYFISYVATTIGFGELPYEFTDVQRLWVVFCIYLTVISWLVAIGNIISLLKDPALKKVWRRQMFEKRIARINNKFFIICGYGETGELLLENLGEKGYQCVVIDSSPERINILDLNSSNYDTPYIQGDVSDVSTLKLAGLENPNCRAILAVTNKESINVKIAAVTKVLHGNVKVVCRASTKEAIANAKSFGTEYVLDTNKIYAETICLGFRTPSIQELVMSLLRRSGSPYISIDPLPKGHWIVCGDDEFSGEMAKFLDFEGIDFSLVKNKDIKNDKEIYGKGTEAVTLRLANIDESVGIVAGTKNDTNNLSIIMTARNLKPNLFTIARQNQDSNRLVFQNAEINSVMESARLLVWHSIPLITQSKLSIFLRLARHQDEQWGKKLLERLKSISNTVPCTYLLKINERKSLAVCQYLESGNILRLQDLYVNDNKDSDKPIALPLLLIRDGIEELLPRMTTPIKLGDIFLMASKEKAKSQVLYTANHEQNFHYVIHGEEKPVSIVMHHIREYISLKKNKYTK